MGNTKKQKIAETIKFLTLFAWETEQKIKNLEPGSEKTQCQENVEDIWELIGSHIEDIKNIEPIQE